MSEAPIEREKGRTMGERARGGEEREKTLGTQTIPLSLPGATHLPNLPNPVLPVLFPHLEVDFAHLSMRYCQIASFKDLRW